MCKCSPFRKTKGHPEGNYDGIIPYIKSFVKNNLNDFMVVK